MFRFSLLIPARFLGVACVLLACATLVSCNREPKRALHMNLTPGSIYALTVRTSGETEIEPQSGEKIKLPTSSDITFVLRPGQVDEHGDVLVKVEAAKSVFPLFFAQMSTAFQGYTFSIKLSQAGRVTEFQDTEAIRQKIGASMPGQESNLDVISDDSLRSMIEPVLSIWPPTPVSVGDSWTRPDIYIPSWDVFESTKFRVESWDNSGAVVKFDSKFSPAGKLMKDSERKFTGKGTGEIHIAAAEGTIRSFESNQEFAGTVTDLKSGLVTKFSTALRTQAELTAR